MQERAKGMRISDWSSECVLSLFSYGFHNPYGEYSVEARKNIETIELQLNMGFSGLHGVDVIIDGEFGFRASTNEGVLVDVEATPRQVEIGEELRKSIAAISSAIGHACRAYRKAYGNPETNEDWDKQSEFCDQDSGVISARAAYNALREESRAINPFAPGHIVDPDLHNEYSEIYNYE